MASSFVAVSRETYVINGEVGDTDGAGLGLGELGHGYHRRLLVTTPVKSEAEADEFPYLPRSEQ